MTSMNGAPGASIGPIGWFLWFWVVMMAAMMLPSIYPLVLAHAQMAYAHARHQSGAVLSCASFVTGYLLSWCFYGVMAYLAYNAIAALNLEWLSWDRYGSVAAAVVVAAAGLYQLTPLKRTCLRHCLRPSIFIINYWRPGLLGALRMGISQGIWCVGCCAGLMALLFVLGFMSLVWMGVITLLVFVEKIVPFRRVSTIVAIVCLALAITIVVSPTAVKSIGTKPGNVDMSHMSM